MKQFHFKKITPKLFIVGANAFLLAACAISPLVSKDNVDIYELHCNADQSVVATGSIRAQGSTWTWEGVILHSSDGGLTYSTKVRGGDIKNVAPRFFIDPRDESGVNRPLIVTGYNYHDGFFSYPLDGWMKSIDSGVTWTSIPPRLPAVEGNDPVGRPPPLVVVDGTGRLATFSQNLPSPLQVISGHHEGTLLISDDHGTTWYETKLTNLAHIFDIRANGHGRLLAIGWTSSLLKDLGAFRTVVIQSDDSGQTWSIAMDEVGYQSCTPSILGSPDGPMLINYWCGKDRLYFSSTDGGRTWNKWLLNRYVYGPLQLVATLDNNRIVGLSIDGKSIVAWTSDDGGNTWYWRTTGYSFLSGSVMQSRTLVTLSDGVVLGFVGDGQVIRSADRGKSWTLIDTGLPRGGNYLLLASCTDGHKLVVLGGEQGMLIRSLDGGITWEPSRIH